MIRIRLLHTPSFYHSLHSPPPPKFVSLFFWPRFPSLFSFPSICSLCLDTSWFLACPSQTNAIHYCLFCFRSEEANKAFSAAVQMHDVLVKAWAMWGDYLENIFVKDRQLQLGVSAITCYLHACRHQNESKSRKYLAKVIKLRGRILWLTLGKQSTFKTCLLLTTHYHMSFNQARVRVQSRFLTLSSHVLLTRKVCFTPVPQLQAVIWWIIVEQ